MTSITLNDDQFSDLCKGFFAKRSARHLLKQQEICAIAERLSEKVTLPFLSEASEHNVLLKVVLKVDNYLYDSLPNEIFSLIHTIDQGFDDAEAAQVAARLTKQANNDITLPFLTDHLEYYSITFILNILVNLKKSL